MENRKVCAECGIKLAATGVDGLCTKCLLKAGLKEIADERQLHIRCPHCRNPIEIVDDTPLRDITCPACDSKFSLIGDATTTTSGDQARHLGQFELLERVGIGGFGAVWKARDTELDRIVAIKVPRREQLDDSDIEKFMREARAAAQLKHPHIVSVHEVGHSDGRVYIVSDYVDGVTLADWLSANQPTPKESTELCAHLATALQHAHTCSVVHRDLKPTNVMIDSRGEPHIMDFGLAKREAGEITMTLDGKVLGTPAYMSPEQASGHGHEADARSDIYSLGVILFEMLTGERPFRGTSRMLLHQVIHDDAPLPRKLNGEIHRDLETICLKCLEKDPARRYKSALEVCDELRRCLAGKPIVARPISRAERTIRWCRRNPLAATLIALLAFLAIAGPTIAFRQHMLVNEIVTVRSAEREALRQTKEQSDQNRRLLYESDLKLAQQASQVSDLNLVKDLLDRHRPVEGTEDRRGFEWYHLDYLVQQGPRCLEHPNTLWSAEFSPNGRSLAIGTRGHGVHVWDMQSYTSKVLLEELGGSFLAVGFSPNGQTLAMAHNAPNAIHLWDLVANQPRRTLQGHQDMVFSVEFSPDGTRLVSSGIATVNYWDVDTGELLKSFANQPGKHAAVFSPDGRVIVMGNQLGEIHLFATSGSEAPVVMKSGLNGVTSLAISPDSRTLLSGHDDGSVRIWNFESRELMAQLDGHGGGVTSLVFSRTGDFFASSSRDRTVKVWDAEQHREIRTLKGHTSYVFDVDFNNTDTMLASVSHDRTTLLWNLGSDPAAENDVLRSHQQGIVRLAVSDEGSQLVTGSRDGVVQLWDLDQRLPKMSIAHGSEITDLAMSPDGLMLATVGPTEPTLRVWNLSDGSEKWTLNNQRQSAKSEEEAILGVAFSRHGNLLATAGSQGINLYDRDSGALSATIDTQDYWSRSPHFLPDGKSLVSGHGTSIGVWNLPNGEKPMSIRGSHGDAVVNVAVSVDGKMIASCSSDGTVLLWRVGATKPLGTLKGHSGPVNSIGFSPDGMALVTGGTDGKVKLWGVAAKKERFSFDGHQGAVSTVTFTPDGLTILSGGMDGTVRLWHASQKAE